MLKLIDHIVRISARRDRTEINTALVEAMADIFAPASLCVYRCFSSASTTIVFACAGIDHDGVFSRNAYLPERRFSWPITQDKLLRQAKKTGSVVTEKLSNGSQRLAFPVNAANQLIYLVDVVISENFPPEKRVLLMGLIEYFTHHIALLDYGETDTLTGLANRKTFDKHLFEVMGKAANDELSSMVSGQQRRKANGNDRHWLAVCDIDHFKHINDNHGHLIGDEVLVMFGRLMRESFRYDDQLFRFGGEEFVAVLQPAKQTNVHAVFERFRTAVEAHVFSRVGHVTVSIGYSQLLLNDTPADVIDRADEALYYAKQHGRNQSACFETLVNTGKLRPQSSEKGEIELF
ncbi:MAG: GGDEF domain-containing protein [Rhodocyclaceae bacterium]|nr:GGDEF domain-containing protein [Rhodocyclaceae bacterium]